MTIESMDLPKTVQIRFTSGGIAAQIRFPLKPLRNAGLFELAAAGTGEKKAGNRFGTSAM